VSRRHGRKGFKLWAGGSGKWLIRRVSCRG
jgi:hypothetical protein